MKYIIRGPFGKVYEKPFNPKRRPTKLTIMAAAKRFNKDGEVRNAVEMIRLADPESKMTVRCRT